MSPIFSVSIHAPLYNFIYFYFLNLTQISVTKNGFLYKRKKFKKKLLFSFFLLLFETTHAFRNSTFFLLYVSYNILYKLYLENCKLKILLRKFCNSHSRERKYIFRKSRRKITFLSKVNILIKLYIINVFSQRTPEILKEVYKQSVTFVFCILFYVFFLKTIYINVES